MSQQVALQVAYPSTNSSGQPTKFDMDYYLKSHMAIIARSWTPFNMTSWNITSYSSADSLDGSTPPYCVMASVRFASLADAKEALAKGSEESGKDIANYTDVAPVIWVAKVEAEEGDCQGKGK